MSHPRDKKTWAAEAALIAAILAAVGLPNTGWAQTSPAPTGGTAEAAKAETETKTAPRAVCNFDDEAYKVIVETYKAAPTAVNLADVKARASDLKCEVDYSALTATTAAAAQFPVYFDGAIGIEQLLRAGKVLRAMALFTATLAVKHLPPSIQAVEKAELTDGEKLATINPRLRRLAGKGNLNLAKRISDLVDAKSSQVAADLKAVFDPAFKSATMRFQREEVEQLRDAAFLIAAFHAHLKMVGCELKNEKILQADADKADGLVKNIVELNNDPTNNASELEAKWAELQTLLETPTAPEWVCNDQDLLYQVRFEQALRGVEPRDKAVAEMYLAKAKGVSIYQPDMRLIYVWVGLWSLPKAYLAFLTDPTRGLPLADVSKNAQKWNLPVVAVTGKGSYAFASATKGKDGEIVGKDAANRTVVIPASDGAVVLQHPAETGAFARIVAAVRGKTATEGARGGWLDQLRLDTGYSLAVGIVADDAEVRGTSAHIVRVGLSYLAQVTNHFFITPYLHGGVVNVQGDSVYRTDDTPSGERTQALLALGTKLGWKFLGGRLSPYVVGEGLFFPGLGGSAGVGVETSALKYFLADFDIRYMGMPDTGVSSGKYWGQPRENIALSAVVLTLTLSL